MHPFLDHDVAINFCNLHLRDMFIVIAWNYLSLLLIFIWTQSKIWRDHFCWRVYRSNRFALCTAEQFKTRPIFSHMHQFCFNNSCFGDFLTPGSLPLTRLRLIFIIKSSACGTFSRVIKLMKTHSHIVIFYRAICRGCRRIDFHFICAIVNCKNDD